MSGKLKRHHRGFTLIELMIVIVVVAILSVVAYPAYTNGILRSHRAEARASVMDAAARQERRYSQIFTYASDMKDLGYTANPLVTENGRFQVSATVSATDSTLFTVTATAVGEQTKDSCDGFSITSKGTKGVTKGTVADCWAR